MNEDFAKRMRYFNLQFLRDNDFKDEQKYHLFMRRLHNRNLHGWGIVNGLEVTASGTDVSVAPGLAIDSEGQEMVLTQATALPLNTYSTGTTVYITLKHDEKDSDPNSGLEGAKGHTRITEQTILEHTAAAPPATSNTLILAKVKRTPTGLDTIDLSDRKQAGLHVSGKDGKVGIGTTAPSQQLTLGKGNILLPAVKAGTDGNLYFGGITDASANGMRLYAGSGEGYMDVRGAADTDGLLFRVDKSNGSTERMRITADGKVGIGTSSPQSTLDVAGTAHFMINYNGTFPSYGSTIGKGGLAIGWNGQPGGKGETDFVNFPGLGLGGFNFALANSSGTVTSTPMVIDGAGKIGIGTTGPDCKLTINEPGKVPNTQNAQDAFANIKNDTHELRLGVSATAAILSAKTASDLELRTDDKARIVVEKTTGNVVIDTDTATGLPPAQKLTLRKGNILLPAWTETDGNLYFGGITDTKKVGMRLFASNASGFVDVRANTDADGLVFRVDNNDGSQERMRIKADGTVSIGGSVGIGIWWPAAPLHVNNTSKTAGAYTAILGHAIAETFFVLAAKKVVTTDNVGDPVLALGLSHRTSTTTYENANIRFHRGSQTDTGFLSFSTGGDKEKLRIDAAGNVGIGTSKPARPLELNQGTASAFSISERLFLDGSSGDTVRITNNAYVDSSGKWAIATAANKAATIEIRNTGVVDIYGTQTANQADWKRMASFDVAKNQVLFPDGKVGIGTNSPTRAKIEVNGNVGNTVALFGGDTTGMSLVGNWPHLGFNCYAADAAWKSIAAGWAGYICLDQGDGKMKFALNASKANDANAALQPVDRLSILPNGNVGIGTPSPGAALEVEGPALPLRLRYNKAAGGRYWNMGPDSNNSFCIYNEGNVGAFIAYNATSWSVNSDVRLKTNIKSYTVLDKLADFRAVSFDWKTSGKHEVGVIAQELAAVFPEIVTKGSPLTDVQPEMGGIDAWSVSYDRLGALSMEGVKELKTLFDRDHAELERLKAANESLAAQHAADAKAIEELRDEVRAWASLGAQRSNPGDSRRRLDCFVASLLAMTRRFLGRLVLLAQSAQIPGAEVRSLEGCE
jgi:hypothetical protein